MRKYLHLTTVFLLAGFFILHSPSWLSAGDMVSDLQKMRGSSTAALKSVKIDIPNKTAFVMLHPDYPVTPGDTYQVSYLYNLKPASLPFFIEADGKADLSFFGDIDTKGMTFGELKVKMEKIVLKAYPDSLPKVTIKSTGAFPVLIKGEVNKLGYAQGWGFSHLSDLIADRLTKYSSLRNVEIVDSSGKSKFYDLFYAAMTSDLKKNPIVKPGDIIVIHRYDREIYLKGEVRRQGAFQLLEGENLGEVIEKYGDGFTKLADKNNLHIIRLNTETGTTDTIYPDSDNNFKEITLRDMDLVEIPSKITSLPVVFFEGALGTKSSSTAKISARIPWPITRDMRISTAVRGLPSGSLTPVSDLERTFVIRKSTGEFIPVNLEKILYEHDYSDDIVLKKGDRIIIPFKLLTVYVGGSVSIPGAYPYVPGKTSLEYVLDAGGFNVDEHVGNTVIIMDKKGKRYDNSRVIQPEDKIFAPKNSPVYNFNNQIGPIVGTTAAVISLTLTILGLFGVTH